MHPQSKWTWTNEFRRLLGYSAEHDFPNVVGSWAGKLHPEDSDRTFAAFAKALKKTSGKSIYNITYRLKMKDGSYRWFRATGGVVHDASGKAVRACGSLVDIHDSVLAEQAANARVARVEELTARFEAEVSSLIGTFQSTSQELQAAARQLAGSARKTSDETSVVVTTVEQAAANISAVASSSEELGASVDEIGRQIDLSAELSKGSVGEAKATAGIMAELSAVAAGIGNVVDLISGLAGQTNLLALNATIEAARAGDSGKGFAVVASEVKQLASQTASATSEISTKVAAIQNSTNRAASAIEGILKTIGSVNDAITSIASAVEEQGSATREIVRSISQVSDGTHVVTENISHVSRAAVETETVAQSLLSSSTTIGTESNTLQNKLRSFIAELKAA
ncbi:methyl-accepting chemotaxis protein [Xanthobacter agilis]|uniref:PAS domain S-box-containing protein n=1 Tax=Xanthobacter agilis TaxID=47492 RepID=A0ABU0LGN6_XANAG|nr:methyl-accepting chemotaxis protein [Xanthobacter agilis]MDQ0506311.1 PAS domain S-box-containing protein [Xanthobacter agilis]